ncbi:Bifunctional inhibitor/plant lipid transfer protein/seed storage helical domain superfamily [Arabidopsis thaliana x Arabidopsis arenosa]|uniref:Bifunctional inhibitor/plant lipid transfer protein/seed storage helical domain superfamily n=2 Tax=Arabidopsis TaxID=3701 RepID=A0A8T2CJJ9_ARASU|nr:Bifunctional inhibitor/plant lipid transfer protein/seed storage helical domain superfamily [Arabidopsis thaliana x Arabidopsis arenosa]KAG7598486.1 Bifunctional inhibitor/plant lipid transfer protein/seed storage helical domain superfamily [Arabidopsis suecica]
MKGLHLHLFLVTMTIVASIAAAAPAAPAGGGALADECSQDFQKVTLCLDFATGKATTPSKKCCDAVEDIKERDPKCLCFVIQQAKTGGQALKDLGVQEDKLIQLPTSCQLHNASITNCPKLLGLSPSSPDAAVFTSNATTSTTPVAPGGKSPATPATSTDKGGSASAKDGHAVVALAITLMTVSFVSTLPRHVTLGM